MKRLITFSAKPYREKQRQIKMLEDNQRRFQEEMAQRRRWKIKNSFDEKPRLDKWDSRKKKTRRIFEDLILGSISFVDAAETASTDLAIGLGIKEALIEMDAVEDLTYNIYLVKLAEILCSNQGANLSKETMTGVIRAIISQLFPPAMPSKPPPTIDKGQQIIDSLMAIKNNRRA